MMLKSFILAAACATVAFAQSIAFTSFPPATVEVGSPVTVTWSGGSSAPVTITLRRGLATALNDVKTLTTTASGGSYTFTLTPELVNGNDYALQISQGSDINYTTQFAVAGGSASSASATVSSITASASSAISSASSAASSITASLSSAISSASAAANSTVSRASASASSTRSSASSSASSASSSASASSSGGATGSSNAAGLSSPIALVLSVVAAMVYLN